MNHLVRALACGSWLVFAGCDATSETEPIEQPPVVLVGGLGRATFEYACVDLGDPQCDLDADLAPLREQSPFPFLAVGSRFQLAAEGEGYGPLVLDSASSDFLLVEEDGVTMQALREGAASVVAAKDGVPVDFGTVELVEPAGLKILAATPQGSFEGVEVDFGNGEVSAEVDAQFTFKFRAIVVDGEGEILAGALPCLWETSDSDVATITSDPADNVVVIVSGEAGSATVSVTYGELTGSITIDVGT
jgi:hypothetical protein